MKNEQGGGKQRESLLRQAQVDLERIIRAAGRRTVNYANVEPGKTGPQPAGAGALTTRRNCATCSRGRAIARRSTVKAPAENSGGRFPAAQLQGGIKQSAVQPQNVQNVVRYTVVISAIIRNGTATGQTATCASSERTEKRHQSPQSRVALAPRTRTDARRPRYAAQNGGTACNSFAPPREELNPATRRRAARGDLGFAAEIRPRADGRVHGSGRRQVERIRAETNARMTAILSWQNRWESLLAESGPSSCGSRAVWVLEMHGPIVEVRMG